MLLRGGFGWGEVELPLVQVPSPLVLVETLTKSPGGHLCPHTFCPCGFVVEFIFAGFFSPQVLSSQNPEEERPTLVEHVLAENE